jgi:hypothetical protein
MQSALILAAAVAAAAAPHPEAQNPGRSQVVTAVENCRQIADNAARLACYDQSVSALAAANARGDVQVVDRGQMREARRSLFGFGNLRLPFFSGSKDRDVQQEPKELVSKLASFHDIGNGFFRFSIADPQSSWESTESSSVFDPKVGDKVTITHGALGSYFVEIGGQRAVHAHRVR